MALGWPRLILLLFACRYATGQYITPEVAAFIPACAQQCFRSFIASNFGSFPNAVCGDSPSLDCLCASRSASGYTVGEGAVQCLISEDNIGFCQGIDATNAVVANAYGMCDNVLVSQPQTHGTLTATLIVQTGSSSVLLIAPGITTSLSADLSSVTGPPTSSSPGTTSSTSTTASNVRTTTATLTTSRSAPTSISRSVSTSSSRSGSTSAPNSVSTSSSRSGSASTSNSVSTSSSRSGSISISTSASRSASTSSTSTLPTASIVRTTSAPTSASTEAITSSTSSAPAASSTAPAASSSLSRGQIAGISAGLAGGFSAFLILALLMTCLRRRRAKRALDRRESDAMPFQSEPPPVAAPLPPPRKKSFYQSRVRNGDEAIVGPGPTRDGVATKIASPTVSHLPPQIPIREESSDPFIFSRRSIGPDTYGMPFSPDAIKSVETERRPPSKLLPEKPNLKLTVPPSQQQHANGLSFSQPVAQTVGGAGRQSTTTQFEEDMDTADTAVNSEDAWGRVSSDGILRSPDHGRAPQYSEQAVYPSRQRSQNGDLYIESLIRAQNQNNAQSRAVPPTRNLLKSGHLSTGALSTYTDPRSSYSDDGLKPPVPQIPQNYYRQPGPYDREAQEFVVSPVEYEDPRSAVSRTGNTADLSPVMESPSSGKSRVHYPKIPETASPTMIRMNYGLPPPQPNFIRGVVPTAQGRQDEQQQQQQPWRGAEIRAQQKRQEYARLQAELQAQAQAQARSPARSIPPRSASANGHASQQSQEKVTVTSFSAPPRSSNEQQSPPSFQTKPYEKSVSPPPRSQTAPLTDATGSGGWKYEPYVPEYQYQSKLKARSLTEPHPQTQNQRPQPSPKQQISYDTQPLTQTNTTSSTTLPTFSNPFTDLTPPSQPPTDPETPPPSHPQPQIYTTPPQVSQPPSSQPQAQNLPIPAPTPNHPLQRTPSTLSTTSANSTSSSLLLQKRLGPQKALALCLRPEEMNEGRKRQQSIWRVLDSSDPHPHAQNLNPNTETLHPHPSPRPPHSADPMNNAGREREKEEWEIFDEGVDLGSATSNYTAPSPGRTARSEQEGEDGEVKMQENSEAASREFERMDLPETREWVPRLTPTRRGDVLFLNVT